MRHSGGRGYGWTDPIQRCSQEARKAPTDNFDVAPLRVSAGKEDRAELVCGGGRFAEVSEGPATVSDEGR